MATSGIIIMTDRWKDECIEVVVRDWIKHFPIPAAAYFEAIRQWYATVKWENRMSRAKTMLHKARIPCNVLRMVQRNWPEFMCGDPQQQCRDAARFMRVISHSVLKPKSKGLIVPSGVALSAG